MENNYENFVETIVNMLPNYLEELGEVEVHASNIQKLQNESYFGISARPAGSTVGICINPTLLFEKYSMQTISIDEVCKSIAAEVVTAVNNAPKIDVDQYMDYANARERLTLQLVGIEGNDYLDSVPHSVIEDMAVVYRLKVDQHSDNFASILITNEIMKSFGITKEQLHEDAISAAMQSNPARLRSMREVMSEMMGVPLEMLPEGEAPLYVASSSSVHGAACIIHTGFLEYVAEKVGGDYFILPSSIHEVIILPDNKELDAADLRAMVRDINASEVNPEDKLTDSIYRYNAENGELKKVAIPGEPTMRKGA